MKREESVYSIRPEQVANGITRKEMKQIECVHKRKKELINETIRQIEENYKKKELRKVFSEIKKT